MNWPILFWKKNPELGYHRFPPPFFSRKLPIIRKNHGLHSPNSRRALFHPSQRRTPLPGSGTTQRTVDTDNIQRPCPSRVHCPRQRHTDRPADRPYGGPTSSRYEYHRYRRAHSPARDSSPKYCRNSTRCTQQRLEKADKRTKLARTVTYIAELSLRCAS